MLASGAVQRAFGTRVCHRSSARGQCLMATFAAMAASVQQSEALSAAQEASIQRFCARIPPLDGKNYKGMHGKLAVVGGCTAYTGAPYYAAQAAHKVGADLTYVLCTPGAAPIIKGFSPDMIVLPILLETKSIPSDSESDAVIQDAQRWLARMSVLVVGPGLGEEAGAQASAARIIRWARDAGLPLVIDGSGITTVASDPSLVQGYKRCVLTPNIAELGRLAQAVSVVLPGTVGEQWQAHATEVASAWDGPILVSKGPRDIITDGSTSVTCEEPGSLKRCGGIGDVLAGTVGTFLGWQYSRHAANEPSSAELMDACHAACLLLRRASRAAFAEHGRAMGAGDILPPLPKSFVQLFGP